MMMLRLNYKQNNKIQILINHYDTRLEKRESSSYRNDRQADMQTGRRTGRQTDSASY